MNSEVSLQILSGGFLDKSVSFELIEQKLNSVLSKLPVSKVFMGWALDKDTYKKTADFLAKRNIGFYLWFPVFSETNALRDLDALIDIHDQTIEYDRKNKGEAFSFYCPNNPNNIEKILDIFESEFVSIGFNGIFLDKIRYPSFGNKHGLNGVLSCFCPYCLDVYKKEDIDLKQLKAALSLTFPTPLGLTAYNGNGEYEFENPAISAFLKLKAKIIYNSLEKICRYFREKNYSIGFDVFAPFLAPFVGQDIIKLSNLCDFIKPMMYRITNAPAGLPFETNALLRKCNILDAVNVFKILNCNPIEKPFDLDFTVRELQNMTSLSACPVYAGMEINYLENIAETNQDYIEETIKAYTQTGIKGLALSWNILDAPEENITIAAQVIG